jgi:hypothetical protein
MYVSQPLFPYFSLLTDSPVSHNAPRYDSSRQPRPFLERGFRSMVERRKLNLLRQSGVLVDAA